MAPIERRSPVIGCRLPHRLLRALDEFVAHYHGERNHQGLGNELIMPKTRPLRSTRVRIGPIEAIDGTPVVDIKPTLR